MKPLNQNKMDKEILQKLENIEYTLKKIQYNNDVFLDNQEFLQVMNISQRTAQQWRNSGVISFSQIGAKIYYRFSDIEELLNKNYKKSE